MRALITIQIVCSLFLTGCVLNQKQNRSGSIDELVRVNFKDAVAQYMVLADMLPKNKFPKSYENGHLTTSGSEWWCSGFYPGSLLLMFEQTGSKEIYQEAMSSLKMLEKEQFNRTTHDLGFMMFCSFGTANRMCPSENYRQAIKNSSESLISRFNPAVGCIRSWDPAPWNSKWQYPVIIDNMMNLEMLMWAGNEFSRQDFIDVAVTHANTTLNNHFREDFSSYHVVSYDTLTGGVEKKNTDQGYADGSSWARGQSWGLYGYTVMYRFTKDERYLQQAVGIANFVLNHPNFPKDKIPYWDFDAPNIPDALRDASAAAIIASALLELQKYVDKHLSKTYISVAGQIIQTLSTSEYKSNLGENGGFLLKHGVGNMPDKSEVNVPLTYGDYYYLEAMKRYLDR